MTHRRETVEIEYRDLEILVYHAETSDQLYLHRCPICRTFPGNDKDVHYTDCPVFTAKKILVKMKKEYTERLEKNVAT